MTGVQTCALPILQSVCAALACQCKGADGPIGIDAIVEAIETEALLRDLTPAEAAQ